MREMFGKTAITLVRGDITKQKVDAIVNAANSGLRGGGGVDGAIHRAGGPSIMEECRKIREEQGGCPPGSAVVTTPGRLSARMVVHTVGPIWNGGESGEPATLAAAYRSSIEAAASRGAKTVAFPSISTGIYGYPVEKAARTALEAVRDAVAGRGLEEVRFVLFSDADLAVYEAALSEIA